MLITACVVVEETVDATVVEATVVEATVEEKAVVEAAVVVGVAETVDERILQK